MIITCPHCQTRYQVTYEAIGAAGRKVQCATCNEAWQQEPLTSAEELQNDRLEQAVDEDQLDEAFSEEEQRVATEATRTLAAEERRRERARAREPQEGTANIDPAEQRNRQRAFTQRQSSLFAQLPMARLRRAARVVGAVILTAMVLTGYLGRTKLVELFPSMAGVYAAAGLKVNVLELDFADASTLRTLVDGKEVLIVSARIVGLATEPVIVPPVVITLIGADRARIYEWSVRPDVRELKAGESVDLKTQLTLPPGNIARVKLAFAGGTGNQTNSPATDDVADEAKAAVVEAPGTDAVAHQQTNGEHH